MMVVSPRSVGRHGTELCTLLEMSELMEARERGSNPIFVIDSTQAVIIRSFSLAGFAVNEIQELGVGKEASKPIPVKGEVCAVRRTSHPLQRNMKSGLSVPYEEEREGSALRKE